MSLNFSADPVSKREKQEMFRQALDEQRRQKRELQQQQQQQKSTAHGPSTRPHAAPGVSRLQDSTEPNRAIPGLDFEISTGGLGQGVLITNFDGNSTRPHSGGSARESKQPYMSALSEMNGRPLHVRQQQFEKESQYRSMLREQIEENKRRKETEKAKLEEEKRKELEEIERLQYGNNAPRRQQHAEFQESPDHPLPSPGRLPPAAYKSKPPQSYTTSVVPGYDRTEDMAPAYGAPRPNENNFRHPPLRAGFGGELSAENELDRNEARDRQGQRVVRKDRSEYLQQTRAPYTAHNDFPRVEYPQERAGYRGNGEGYRQRVDSHGHHQHDGSNTHDQKSNFGAGVAPGGGEEEATARRLAIDEGGAGGGRGIAGIATTGVPEAEVDVVPRSDFDELSSLCRDLLLEQKELRRKLEEREERDRLAEQTQPQRSKPRRASAGSQKTTAAVANASDRGDGSRRRISLQLVHGQMMQEEWERGHGLRRDRFVKPGVAFGSTVPRTPLGSKEERPRVDSGQKQGPRGGGGDRDRRTSKSEPVQQSKDRSSNDNGSVRRHRTAFSSNGIVTGGTLFGSKNVSGSTLARVVREDNVGISSTKPCDRFVGGSVASTNTRARGRWAAARQENTSERFSGKMEGGRAGGPSHDETAGGTIHGPSSGEPRVSSLPADAGFKGDSNGRNDGPGGGYDELGGESTFLAAHPLDSGIRSVEGGFGGRGGAGAFSDPRGAADPWNGRR